MYLRMTRLQCWLKTGSRPGFITLCLFAHLQGQQHDSLYSQVIARIKAVTICKGLRTEAGTLLSATYVLLPVIAVAGFCSCYCCYALWQCPEKEMVCSLTYAENSQSSWFSPTSCQWKLGFKPFPERVTRNGKIFTLRPTARAPQSGG